MRAVALLVVLAACRGGESEKRAEPPGPVPPQPTAKLAPIDYAPEGSPFVLASLEPSPFAGMQVDLARGALDELARRPRDDVSRFALALLRDLQVIEGTARFAIYAVGDIPVARIEVADERAGRDALERAVAGLASAERADQGGRQVWWVADGETALVATVQGGHALAAVASRARLAAGLDALLAAPTGSAAKRVRDAAARHQLTPQLVLDASTQTVLQWILAGDASAWWHPAALPAPCGPLLDELAAPAPRIVAGLAAAPAPEESRVQATLELTAPVRERLEALRGAPPLWHPRLDRVLFEGHLALRGAGTRALVADLRGALERASTACGAGAPVAHLSARASHIEQQAWADGVRGASLVVVAARDRFIEAYAGVAADDLAPVIAHARRALPGLRAPSADGTFGMVLPAGTIADLRVDLLAALKRDILLVTTRNEAQKRVGAAPSAEPAPLASLAYLDEAGRHQVVVDVGERGLTATLTASPAR